MLGFYLNATRDMGDDGIADIEQWAERRRAHLAAGVSHLTVGHCDVLVTRTV